MSTKQNKYTNITCDTDNGDKIVLLRLAARCLLVSCSGVMFNFYLAYEFLRTLSEVRFRRRRPVATATPSEPLPELPHYPVIEDRCHFWVFKNIPLLGTQCR